MVRKSKHTECLPHTHWLQDERLGQGSWTSVDTRKVFFVKLSAFILLELWTVLVCVFAAETESQTWPGTVCLGEGTKLVACLARLQERSPESGLCWCCGLAESSSRQCVCVWENYVCMSVCWRWRLACGEEGDSHLRARCWKPANRCIYNSQYGEVNTFLVKHPCPLP